MDYGKTGALILQMRREKEMTQKQLGDMLNISPTTVSKWERGAGFPDISLVEPLCTAIGISIAELFEGERKEPDTDTATETLSNVVRESNSQISRVRSRLRIAAVAAAIVSLVIPLALVAAALSGAFDKPAMRGTYQSKVGVDENVVCMTVAIQDYENEKSFVLYLNDCPVDSGKWRYDGGTLYTLLGDCTRTVISLERDNSFYLTYENINGGEPIKMEKKGDVPVYYPQSSAQDTARYRALVIDEFSEIG